MTDVPQPAQLEISVEPGATTTLTLVGELDPATAPQLDARIQEVLAVDGVERLVLDLAGLAFVDSSGLRVFVTARHTLNERGAELSLRSPSATTQRLLDITGLDEIITVD